MGNSYLAVDIGASSGRVMAGSLSGGKIEIEERHRFQNGLAKKDGRLCWDLERIFREIIKGIKNCADKEPVSVGIDTWGVDFVLLDEELKPLGPAVGYRDDRTRGMDEEVYKLISQSNLYRRVGIQKQIFNTVFQLMAVKKQEPELLSRAKHLLMVPDYLHFLLTGRMTGEYTIASTSGLLDPVTKDWDYELIELLGYPADIFPEIKQPGYVLGDVLPEIEREIGYKLKVVLPPSHDTASAVAAVPCPEGSPLYLSSGTWSLLGAERDEPDCGAESEKADFTNEGGCEGKIRYLKNIMGLWMIQSVRKELPDAPDYGTLSDMARAEEDFPGELDVNDGRFLSPESMTGAIRDYCREKGQPVPETAGQILALIYRGLAECYRKYTKELEQITGETYSAIHIVGGGSQDKYLNELTAKALGIPVLAGPTEATALGNIIIQMKADGKFSSLKEARSAIGNSFPPGGER